MGEMEADGKGRSVLRLAPGLGNQLVGAAQLLSIIAEEKNPTVEQSEGAQIAVVARLDSARIIVLRAVDEDVRDSLAE